MNGRTLNRLVSTVAALLVTTAMSGVASAAEGFVVEFRLPEWRSAQFDTSQQATTFSQAIVKLGCEARQHAHAGHFDVTYRCPGWRALQVSSDEAAHRWEDWLRATGFQTRHFH